MKFKIHKAKVDAKYANIEKDFTYWMEHVVHWHLALLAIVAVLLFSYLLFDPSAPAWAKF